MFEFAEPSFSRLCGRLWTKFVLGGVSAQLEELEHSLCILRAHNGIVARGFQNWGSDADTPVYAHSCCPAVCSPEQKRVWHSIARAGPTD
jgi:hypothetical protein